jgi:hypothetical protein
MAFTSIELVRTHLTDARMGELLIRCEPVTLNGTAASSLAHGGIIHSSVVVKARRSDIPIHETRLLSSDWVTLQHGHLIEGTVVVAADGSLGHVFVENTDFVVDAIAGRIRRVESGGITNGQEVIIWYSLYHVYVEGDDFTVDAGRGLIARRSSGAITDGQQVFVDYAVALGSVSDTVIEQAIAESGEAVLALVDPAYHDSPAPAIVIGATHWAVAMVARMRAASVLSDNPASSSEARVAAQTWLEISQKYDASGRDFLTRFAAPLPARQALRRG